MQGGGSPHQGAYTRLHVDLPGRCEPKRCCLPRFRAVCTHPASRRSSYRESGQGRCSTEPWRPGSHCPGAQWDTAIWLTPQPPPSAPGEHPLLLGLGHSLGSKTLLFRDGQHRETCSDLLLVRSSSVLVPVRLASVLCFPKVSDPPELSTMGVGEALGSDGQAPEVQSQACLGGVSNQAEGSWSLNPSQSRPFSPQAAPGSCLQLPTQQKPRSVASLLPSLFNLMPF